MKCKMKIENPLYKRVLRVSHEGIEPQFQNTANPHEFYISAVFRRDFCIKNHKI